MAVDKLLLEKIMANDTNLTTLDFSKCKQDPTDTEIKSIATAITTNTTILSINLEGKDIGDAGVKKLTDVLKLNTTVESINFGGNKISPEGAQDIADLIEKNTHLKSINLWGNQIGPVGFSTIANAIIKNTALRHINLNRNAIGNTGAQNIAKLIEEAPFLQSIELEGNEISDEAISFIATAIKNNSILKTINLKKNCIKNDGANKIADALKENTTLQFINLAGNAIGDNGLKWIANTLKYNTTLTSIDLRENFTSDINLMCLVEALASNYTLTSLHIYTPNQTLANYLKRNKQIISYLEPINSFIKNLQLDAATISNSIKQLEILIPTLPDSLNNMGDNNQICEQYRLLNGLGYLTEAEATTMGFKAALKCLIHPFKQSILQPIADIAIAQLLYNSHYFEQASEEQRKVRWQTVLHGLSNALHRPELRLLAYSALLNLLHPNKPTNSQAIQDMQNNTAFLSHNIIRQLAAQALAQNTIEDEGEQYMLESLTTSNCFYHQKLMPILCQSKAFLNELKLNYPKKISYTVIEELLIAQQLQDPIHIIPTATQGPLASNYVQAMSLQNQDVEKAVEKIRHELFNWLDNEINVISLLAANQTTPETKKYSFFSEQQSEQNESDKITCPDKIQSGFTAS